MRSIENWPGLALLALLSLLLSTGCSATLPRSDPGIQCPDIPPLSPQSRQPSGLAPLLESALPLIESWLTLLEKPASPAPGAKPSTIP